MPAPVQVLVLVVAGAVAGTIGAAGGITSLVSYSALLAVGVPPLQANAANLVAVVACGPGSVLTSRRELARARGGLPAMLAVAAGGAAAGSVLLLVTPPGVFGAVVPWLVALAALLLLAQPRLTGLARARPRGAAALLAPLLGLVSVYGGYFGAGAGIMVLTLLLVAVDDRLPEANAVKNVLLGGSALVSAVVLVAAGPVPWAAVAPLAVGLFGGGALGPVVARRLPAPVVRTGVAVLGLGLAAALAVRSG